MHNNNFLNICKPEYHIEDVEKFKNSYFSAVYRNAFLCVERIIAQNENQEDRYERNGRMLRTYGYGVSSHSDEEICNIMTFVGSRGTGKTSVMLSFMEALRGYNGYQLTVGKEHVYPDFFKVFDLLFTCLDCIDGSLLEHGENIFKLVLAQMYQKFIDLEQKDHIYKTEDFDYQRKQLLSELESIYKTVCDIEVMEKEQAFLGESYMSGLQSLSNSQKVRRDFKRLIEAFTSLMKYRNGNPSRGRSGHYVVITIDDIDLNIKNGFSMLEKLHRYCMVPNVIILLSIDMEQTMLIAKRHFYEVLPKVDDILCKQEWYIQRLSMDYLDKVMPLNYRLYIPKITDGYSVRSVSIEKEKRDIKHTILGKLYRRTGICFDSQGIKRHFYEPESMRGLTGFYLLLDSMDLIDADEIFRNMSKKEETTSSWEDNCQSLMADLSQRMALEKLYDDEEAYKLYKSIEKEDIFRANAKIIEFYQNQMDGEDSIYIYQGEEPEFSYGDLVETIYDLGRIKENRYKRLVHCLLAYLTYAYTKIYVYEKQKIKDRKGNLLVKKGKFETLIGGSLVELWAGYMIPATRFSQQADSEISELTEVPKEETVLSLASLSDVMLAGWFETTLKEPEDFSTEEEAYIYAAKLIYKMELLLLFLNNIKESKKGKRILGAEELVFKIEKAPEGGYFLKIESAGGKISLVGEYNILNIIMNSMYAYDRLTVVEEKLFSVFVEQYPWKRNGRDIAYIEGCLRAALNLYSLAKQYYQWEMKYGKASLPLPVYWFDFTYNILKRAKRELLKENPEVTIIDKTYDYMSTLYCNIGEQLKKQQEFYKTDKKENDQEKKEYLKEEEDLKKRYPFDLYDIFAECPAVKFFLSSEEKETGRWEKQEKEVLISEAAKKIRQSISKSELLQLGDDADTEEKKTEEPVNVEIGGIAKALLQMAAELRRGSKLNEEPEKDAAAPL